MCMVGCAMEGHGWLRSPQVTLTLLCAQMAEPRSFQVPPLRSIRSMRRICRKRKLRRDVAKTLPWFPTATTGTEAISTKMSGKGHRESSRGEGRGQEKAMVSSQGHLQWTDRCQAAANLGIVALDFDITHMSQVGFFCYDR